jgi:hypothetical protein
MRGESASRTLTLAFWRKQKIGTRLGVKRPPEEAAMKYFVAAGHVPGAGASGQGLEEGKVAV